MPGTNSKRDNRFTTEFIVAGVPWVTSSLASAVKYHPFQDASGNNLFSQWVQVRNTGLSGSLTVAFTSTGFSTNNFFTLTAGQSFEKPLMVYQVYVSGSANQPYSVIAGLTSINSTQIPNYLSSSANYINV